jgi:hypothetical protein
MINSTTRIYGAEILPTALRSRVMAVAVLCPVDQLVRLVNWATFLVQYINICQLINWSAIDKWKLMYC